MFLRYLRQIPGLPRPSVSLGSEEQALIDELRSVQDRLTRSVDLANLHEDPLRFPLRAISDLAELQVTTHIKAIHLLRQLARVADQVNRPSEAFRTQVEKSFQRVSIGQWFRFSVMVGVLLAVTVSIAGAIVAGAVIESHRNTPDAEALLTASGKFPVAWAAMIRKNDLPYMIAMCAKSQNVGALPNGMHYCSVPLIMDGVQANPPTLPAWGKDTASGAPQ